MWPKNQCKKLQRRQFASFLAEVFERVAYNQLKLIIIVKISKTQHGIVSNKNIETNLMEMTTLAQEAFESKAQLDVFYANISKAFDTVNPSKLQPLSTN